MSDKPTLFGEENDSGKSLIELMRRVNEGDRDALEEVMERYEPKIRKRAYGIAKREPNKEDVANDLVQEVALKAVTGSFKSVRGNHENFYKSYTQTTIKRSYLGRKRKEVCLEQLPDKFELVDPTTQVARSDFRLGIGEWLKKEFPRLSERAKLILRWRTAEGELKQEEIAQRLGVTPAVVCREFKKIRESLHKYIPTSGSNY